MHDLNKVSGVPGWDQGAMMPPKGAAVRAEQIAALNRVAHEKFTSDEIGRLLDDLRPYEESLPYDPRGLFPEPGCPVIRSIGELLQTGLLSTDGANCIR